MSRLLSLLNLTDPEILDDPYPFYSQLRAQDPVHWDEYLKAWICTRYADVSSALRDARFSANRILSADQLSALGLESVIPLYSTLSEQLLFLDAPDHTQLRVVMNSVFTFRRVEIMRSYIQQVVDTILDRVQQTGQMDIIQDLAYPLPATIIAEMLGVPHQNQDQLKKWSDDYASMLGSFQYIPERVMETLQSMKDMSDYFQQIILAHQQEPQDDLISALIAAREQHASFTDNALITNCILLISAGQETTTNLIGNGILTLMRHPEQLTRLQENSELIPGAVEELLRYESPAQYTARRATEDLEIGGKQIQQGQVVILVMGAANRDPSQFRDPDRFDISRKENRHLAFGYAAHFCLGAPLARLEAQIAIKSVFQRFPGLKLANERAQWGENINLHGLATLPVVLE